MILSGTRPSVKRPTTPARGQPGTFAEQVAAINAYLRLPLYYRTLDPADAWAFARALAMPHARREAGR